MSRWKRVARTLSAPSGLAGAFFFFAVAQALEPSWGSLLIAPIGWLYGIGVAWLIRLFRVAPWAYLVAGGFCGPIPFAVIMTSESSADERGGLWLASALLGASIGLLEWARARHGARSTAEGGPAS